MNKYIYNFFKKALAKKSIKDAQDYDTKKENNKEESETAVAQNLTIAENKDSGILFCI